MGGASSRNKGQRGEREVAKLLQPIVDKVYSAIGKEIPVLGRNLQQSRDGGFDLSGLDWIAIEVKFQESFNLLGWWVQTTQQAGEHRVPVLFYRKRHHKWRIRMMGDLPIGIAGVGALVDIDLNTFLQWFEVMVEYKA